MTYAFLVLDLGLDVLDRVGWLDLQGDGLAGEGLDENLHDNCKGEEGRGGEGEEKRGGEREKSAGVKSIMHGSRVWQWLNVLNYTALQRICFVNGFESPVWSSSTFELNFAIIKLCKIKS